MGTGNSKYFSTLYPGLRQFLLENVNSTKSISELYEESKKFGYTNSCSAFRSYLRKMRQKLRQQNANEVSIPSNHSINLKSKILSNKPTNQLNTNDFINLMKKNKIINIIDACNHFNCPPKNIESMITHCIDDGYQVFLKNDKIIFNIDRVNSHTEKIPVLEDKEICFGVASDLHFGSKCIQITALNEFANICKQKGVKHIFSPGDILAGNNVYKGQIYDLYAIGCDEQVDSVLTNLPTGFEWYFMGGNHDYSFIRSGGQNPLIVLSNKRKDIHYCGFDEVDVPILQGVDLKMWHPSGGVPYSVSYRLQKGVEQIAFSELQSIVRGVKDKPSIRFVLAGHLHIQMQALFGSILGCQCGTFEGQTNYLKVKGLVPAIGGYIIKASLGRNGLLKNFEVKFYVFEEIPDDWKSYNHAIENKEKEKKFKPIFE